jgi:hypothetical protein
MVDVIFGLDGGELPEVIVSDTGSYSDVVFGLLELLGISYRPALEDLPDQKGWRFKADADYGPLSTFARGRIDTAKIRRNWEDILRVVASIYTGAVRGHHAAARRPPHRARRGDCDVRADLQVAAHPQLHRHRRNLPARHQGHPQPARRPPRPGPEDLPREERRAVPPVRARPGEPARRARPCPELRRPVDDRLPRCRCPPAQGPGLPGARGGHGSPVPVRQPAPRGPRHLQLRSSGPGPGAIRDLRDPDAADEDDE